MKILTLCTALLILSGCVVHPNKPLSQWTDAELANLSIPSTPQEQEIARRQVRSAMAEVKRGQRYMLCMSDSALITKEKLSCEDFSSYNAKYGSAEN
jgi:hypothetical protein